MEVAEHIAAIRRDAPLLSAAAAVAGLEAPVPSCPEWVVRDLLRHQGGVHRWATAIVATPRTEPWRVDLDEVAGTWPDDTGLLDWLEAGYRGLIAALENASSDLQCWTFLRAPSPLAMWARRQAHETAMHRADAELAAGRQAPAYPARFAADGIDELLSCFITRRSSPLRADPARTFGVRCHDVAADWLVRIGPDAVRTTAIGDEVPDCTLRGRADELYLALWSRPEWGALSVQGDRAVLDLFLDKVHIRWT